MSAMGNARSARARVARLRLIHEAATPMPATARYTQARRDAGSFARKSASRAVSISVCAAVIPKSDAKAAPTALPSPSRMSTNAPKPRSGYQAWRVLAGPGAFSRRLLPSGSWYGRGMHYRNLGTSGVKVSSLCFGAMTFGEADEKSFMHKIGSDEATSHELLDRAVDAGVNFVDTADVYGQDGLSERVLGAWFERGGGRRNKIVLATKFRFAMGDGANKSGASRYRIVRCVEDSLRRLKTDRIDLYQIHMQDVATPEEETVRALDDLVRSGKVVYLGASNYAAHRLVDSVWIAKHEHRARFVSLQAQYSLVVRDLERELVPACRAHGLGVLPYSPLAGGLLSGKYRRGDAAPSGTRYEQMKKRFGQLDNERSWNVVDAVVAVAKETGATPSQVALAWVLGRDTVASVIFGARSREQLDDNLKAAELALSDAQKATLDRASAIELGYPYQALSDVQGRW